jgi:ribosomal protein L37AE/L43A
MCEKCCPRCEFLREVATDIWSCDDVDEAFEILRDFGYVTMRVD